MEIITANDFDNKSTIEIVYKLMRMNDGYITSKQLTQIGIHRMYLNIMQKKGIIKKVGNGIYMESIKIPDKYYILSMQLPNVVFSHMTALFFHNLSNKAPGNKFDITVPNDYFNYKIKNYNVFYVNREVFELGLTRVETPMGNLVKAYDVERCICDIIKSRKRIGLENVKNCIREYLSMRYKDLVKLLRYAQILGIKDDVIQMLNIMEDNWSNNN